MVDGEEYEWYGKLITDEVTMTLISMAGIYKCPWMNKVTWETKTCIDRDCEDGQSKHDQRRIQAAVVEFSVFCKEVL